MRRKNVREKYFHVHIRRGCEGKTSKQTYARTLSFTHTHKHTLSLSLSLVYKLPRFYTHTISHTPSLSLSCLPQADKHTLTYAYTKIIALIFYIKGKFLPIFYYTKIIEK